MEMSTAARYLSIFFYFLSCLVLYSTVLYVRICSVRERYEFPPPWCARPLLGLLSLGDLLGFWRAHKDMHEPDEIFFKIAFVGM